MGRQSLVQGIRNPDSASPALQVSGQTTFTTTGLTKQVAVTGITTVDAVICSFAAAPGSAIESIWCAKTQSTGNKITVTRVSVTPVSGRAFGYIGIGH